MSDRVSVRSLKAEIANLNDSQLEQLFNYIGEMLTVSSFRATLNKDFRESRFSKGEVCLIVNLLMLLKMAN